MRFWNFVVNCIALPASSTVYAAGSGVPHPASPGKPRADGQDPGHEALVAQPGTARPAQARLHVVN